VKDACRLAFAPPKPQQDEDTFVVNQSSSYQSEKIIFIPFII
jgi:hypothetical protein